MKVSVGEYFRSEQNELLFGENTMCMTVYDPFWWFDDDFFQTSNPFQVESSRRNPRRGRTHRAGVISMPFFDWQWCRSWKHEDQLLTLVKQMHQQMHFLIEFYFGIHNHIIYVVIDTYTNAIIWIWSWSTSTMGSRLDVAQVCLVLPDLPGDFKMM